MKRTLFAIGLAALLVAAPCGAQDFTRYVALGDSLTAGFSSLSLIQTHQEGSYPALLARQAGTPDFQMPLISAPGIPPILELQSLAGPIIAPTTDVPGVPINAELPVPYANLGVVSATVYDTLFATGDITNLLTGNIDPNTLFRDVILRIPQVQDPTTGALVDFTAMAQAIAQQPTFVTMWIGSNDLLYAIITGTPLDLVTMTPLALFEQLYTQAVGALVQMTSADIVVFTLAEDLSAIPFVSTIAPYIDVPGAGRFPLIGSNGPLTENDFVTLGASELLAQGIGVPVELGGTGVPLPEDIDLLTGTAGVVIRADEMAVIEQRAADYNAIIRAAASALGAHVFDVNPTFERVVAGDMWIFGGVELSADFLIGGVFSYDGIHIQDIGQALLAVELIDFINEEFGADIPQVNMSEILCTGGCGGGGEPLTLTKNAVFTKEAFDNMVRIFRPTMPPQRVHHTAIVQPEKIPY